MTNRAEATEEIASTYSDTRLHALSGDVRTSDIQHFLNKTDIWVNCILPFVGPGHFIFVASTCRILKEYYKQYVGALQKLSARQAPINSKTFYSVAFATVSCAEIWFHDTGINPQSRKPCNALFTTAAKLGNLPVLMWAHEKGFGWDSKFSHQAAEYGHLEVLKWLNENGCPWDSTTWHQAAKYGHLEVLKWLHDNGCPWNENTCSSAAFNGHLETLKWLHDNGCPWDKWTCLYAAAFGHLEVLKWARGKGCPWDWRVRWSRSQEVVEWAIENGCPEIP